MTVLRTARTSKPLTITFSTETCQCQINNKTNSFDCFDVRPVNLKCLNDTHCVNYHHMYLAKK